MKKQKIKKILFPTHGIQILDFLVNPLIECSAAPFIHRYVLENPSSFRFLYKIVRSNIYNLPGIDISPL